MNIDHPRWLTFRAHNERITDLEQTLTLSHQIQQHLTDQALYTWINTGSILLMKVP